MFRARPPLADPAAARDWADTTAGPAPEPLRLCHFLGVELELGAGVLVPRAETELLGEGAIALLAGRPAPLVIDMCCGSGNLALAIATRIPTARLVASDLTGDSVAVARRNVARHGLGDRITVTQGDLFETPELASLAGRADLIVSNPPYISSKRLAGDRAYLLAAEPREAFDGGPYGVSIQQRLVRDAPRFLRPGGWLAFEFGHGQERVAASLIGRSGQYDELRFLHDDDGAPRVALTRLGG